MSEKLPDDEREAGLRSAPAPRGFFALLLSRTLSIPEVTESAPKRTPRRILSLGGLGLVVLGVAKLAHDALNLTRTETAWLPILAGGALLTASAIWLAIDTPPAKGLREAPPEQERTRSWIAVAVVALMLIQSVIPLRYYLGDDPFDERFSWRMFSAVRVYECRLSAFDETDAGAVPVNLMTEIHVGWVTTMRRNRQAVVDRYLRWRCDENELAGARVVNRCVSPEGNEADVIRHIDCAAGVVDDGEAP